MGIVSINFLSVYLFIDSSSTVQYSNIFLLLVIIEFCYYFVICYYYCPVGHEEGLVYFWLTEDLQ